MSQSAITGVLLLPLLLCTPFTTAAATSCEDLSKISLPNTTITLAQTVAAGSFTPPPARGGAPAGNPFANVPAFCRLQATLKPSADSDIKMEIWMPVAANRNGKLRGTGNGGLGGGAAVNANALANGVRLGYATDPEHCKVAMNYYKAVLAKTGEKPVKESMRFFMAPGMGHGPRTTGDENFNYDALSVTGKAPDELTFDHYKNGMMVGKRLVCQYPKVPAHQGSGNAEDPASFVCK